MTRLALALLLAAGTAAAEPATPPTENVTVTGARSRQVLEKFVAGVTTASRITGKLARWSNGACPVTVGLAPRFAAFISRRIKDVAAQVGAPVAARKDCKVNIEIVFTTTPQALISNVRAHHRAFLGYYDNEGQLDRLATVSRPIQAWYTTATRDVRGKEEVDTGQRAGIGLQVPCEFCPGGTMYLPNATAASVTGSRLGDGMTSSLYHVIIAADPNRLKDYEIGPLADYIAMLALAQVNILAGCQPLSSIINLLLPGCGKKNLALTGADLGYLKGLYRMSGGRTLRIQQDQIAYQMEQTLAGK